MGNIEALWNLTRHKERVHRSGKMDDGVNHGMGWNDTARCLGGPRCRQG